MQVNIKKVIGVHSPRKQKIQVETITDIRRAIAVDVGEDQLLLNDVVNAEQVKKDDHVFVFRAGHTLNYRLVRAYSLDRTLCVELKEQPGTYVLLEDTFLPVKIVFPGGFKHPETKEKIRFNNIDYEFDYSSLLGVGIFEDLEKDLSESETNDEPELVDEFNLDSVMEDMESLATETLEEVVEEKKSRGKKGKKK